MLRIKLCIVEKDSLENCFWKQKNFLSLLHLTSNWNIHKKKQQNKKQNKTNSVAYWSLQPSYPSPMTQPF